MRLLIAACMLLPLPAAAEPLAFVRVDQTGGIARGDADAAYRLEMARPVIAVEGSSDRGNAYVGGMHRLFAGWGIVDWLAVGLEQSVKQLANGDLKVGVLMPELRARLDELGFPVRGLGAYMQGHVRVTARRPPSLVGGFVFDQELGSSRVAARLGFERTVQGPVPESGLRAEAGLGWRVGESWRVAAEAWGHTAWRTGAVESEYHAGPSAQYRVGPASVGAQLGVGLRSRTRLLVLDSVAMLRLAVGF